MSMSDSESSYGLEMMSSRLEREAQKKALHEARIADPIFSSIGHHLGRWQYQLIILLMLIKFPAVLIEISGIVHPIITLPNQKKELLLLHENVVNNDAFLQEILSMIGLCFGHLFFGIFGDTRGRKPTLALALFLQTFSSVISAFIPSNWLFYILYFLTNFASGGIMILSFVMAVEFCGSQLKELVTVLILLPTGLSYLILATIKIWIHNIQKIIFIVSIPSVSFMCALCLIPESPEWFFMINSINRTANILINAAIKNRLPHEHILNVVNEAQKRKDNFEIPSKGFRNVLKLFHSHKLCIRAFCVSLSWTFIYSFMYGSIQQQLQLIQIHGSNGSGYNNNDDIYKDFIVTIAINGALILIGTLFSYLIIKYFGYKRTILIVYLLICFSLISMIFIPEKMKWFKVALSLLIVTIGIGMLQSGIQILMIEIFPIHLRCTGIGFMSTIGKIGSILIHRIVMYTMKVQKTSTTFWLIPLIYCSVCVIAGVMILCLSSFAETNKNNDKDLIVNNNEGERKLDIIANGVE